MVTVMNNDIEGIYKIFSQIKEASGKNEKVQIIKNNAGNREFKNFLNFLYNDMITTGLSSKKIEKKLYSGVRTVRGFESAFNVMNYVEQFNTGTDSIIDACQMYLNKLEEPYQSFMKEVLTKSYKCGITSGSVNKAIPNHIPEFKCMLAHPYSKYADKIEGSEFVLTQKLDGHRTLIFYDGYDAKFRTRKGHEIMGLTELEAEVKSMFPVAIGRSLVIDGEITIADKSVPIDKVFQETSKIIRKDGVKTGLRYHVFDILPEDEFWAGETNALYFERRDAINHLFAKSSFKPKLVELVKELYRGNDVEMISKFMKLATDNGWEGIMLNLNEPYKNKRTSGLLKVKEFFSADIIVSGYEEGSGKYTGTLGALVLDFNGHEVKLGTGFTDKDRDEIWSTKDDIIGKVVQVDYFEETENQKGGKSLRFPSFKGFRLDKTADDVNIE